MRVKSIRKRKSVGARLRSSLSVTPYRYQIRGVRFVEKHKGRALIGDDMGLGKTLQALGWAMIHPEARPMVIVCPSSLKLNWQRELMNMGGATSTILEGELPSDAELDRKFEEKKQAIRRRKKHPKRGGRARALKDLRTEFQKRRAAVKAKRQEAKKADILIINYDIIDSWMHFLLEIGIKLFVLDECHYVMNMKAKRTKACRRLSRTCTYIIGLSGTPITAGPVQFFPILNMIRPEEFPSHWKYCMTYCDPKKGFRGRGWDFSGSSNLDDLHERVQDVMIRRMKREVLKDLPEKTRTVMPVDISNRKDYNHAETDFLNWVKKNKGAKALKAAQQAEALVKMGALLQLAAEGKLKYAIDWIKDWLASTDEKLVIFARHRKILNAIAEAFPTAARVDGSVPMKKRQEAVDRFQTDPKCRLFIGHLKAAGVGLTLTAASNVLKLEIGWTPADHDQAEDRVLRIGQKANAVTIYYLVGTKTIEEKLLEVLDLKSARVGRVLDGRGSTGMRLLKELTKRMVA